MPDRNFDFDAVSTEAHYLRFRAQLMQDALALPPCHLRDAMIAAGSDDADECKRLAAVAAAARKADPTWHYNRID